MTRNNDIKEGEKSGKTTVGVKVAGAMVSNGVSLSRSELRFCELVPIAKAVGIPLAVQILNEPPPDSNLYSICRFMSIPETGFSSMHWCFGGSMGPAPVVALGRLDGVPFTDDCFSLLDDFEMIMLDEGPRPVGARDFDEYIAGEIECHEDDAGHQLAPLVLAWAFPRGCEVMAIGLKSNTDLNGQLGKVIGKYHEGRVGVRFCSGVKAMKPENMRKI